jgi:UDP-N-acetylmuramyl tripeptide synthase
MEQMPLSYSVILGKSVKKIAALRGGGSALPGLFVEKIDKKFISRTLANLEHGVVIISGTNGKTTTTKMVVELLEGQGLKVFTNRTGSNFTRGVAAALLGEIDMSGKLHADIAVLELDEAHAVHFVQTVQPRYSLLLNVFRDQLDRFGEIDATAKMLQAVAEATSRKVIINREDPRLGRVADALKKDKVSYFGLSKDVRSFFPSDDNMRDKNIVEPKDDPASEALVSLTKFSDHSAAFAIGGKSHTVNLQLEGVYNTYNAAAALALVATIAPDFNVDQALKTLSTIKPAFGRGEKLVVDGQPLEIVLVKNPSGFRLGLQSFSAAGYATMIAINDNYADGRDMSWLWDVEFDSLKTSGAACVSGVRAYDMALRLQYDEVEIAHVTTDLHEGLVTFIKQNKAQPKRIFCTYTAMLSLRKQLAKITDVEVIS